MVGDLSEVAVQVAAQDVAQQRAQVAAELAAERIDVVALRREAGDDRALDRDGVRDPLGERVALLGDGAQRREPAGQAAARRALGLEQGAERQQVVGQRLARRRSLEAELEAAKRPRELAGARRAAADQVAERAQLVLLRGRDRQQAVRRAGRAEDDHLPRAAGRLGPRGGGERRHAAVVEAQRGEQPPEPHARVLDRRRVAGRCLPGQHREDVGVDRRIRQGLAPHEHEPFAQVELLGAQVHADQRRDDDRLGAAVAHDGLELRVGGLEALVGQDEVGRVLERAGEEQAQSVFGALARVTRDRLSTGLEVAAQAGRGRERVDGRQVGFEAAEEREALVDERPGQGPVAVQARAPRAALLDDLEGHLGTLGGVVSQQVGGLVGKGPESVMKSRVAHECCGSPGVYTTPSGCKNLPKAPKGAALPFVAAWFAPATCASGCRFVVGAGGAPNRGMCAGPFSCVPSPCSA